MQITFRASEQDDNALFYQIMCVLHGDAFTGRPGGQLVTDLSDIIFYMDFSGIFDRSGADFGSGPHRYLAFERSGRKEERKQMRHYYFGHLTDVVMVDSNMLAAERLGGADYDGDMIKTISDPILNACVRRNYNLYRYEKHKSLTNTENIPLLMIPTAQPQIRSADDWEARFETVRSTFSSRVGQICNAALDRSIIAYNENSDAEERERCRKETETLAILTGLEIDSAKSGIRPDLDEYLTHKTVKRSAFLKYKTLVEEAETRRAWYEPTHAARVKAFFKKVDWDAVDSNVERLPYLAQQLKKNTPRIKAKPAKDEELFSFAAQQPDWREQLNSDKLAAVDALLQDYDVCLSRIRACRAPVKEKKRKSDVERILYAVSALRQAMHCLWRCIR